MTNKVGIVSVTVYFALICYPHEVIAQGFTSYDDFLYPPENYGYGQVTQNSESYKSFLLYPPQCGLSNGEFNRVVNGNPAAPGAWPWMAPIFISFTGSTFDEVQLCGGTIISSRHVLTAAHCFVHGQAYYTVHLGINNIREDGVRMIVEHVIIHPDYNEFTNENDIAIMRLSEKINFTDEIRPICLPLSPDIRNRDFTRNFPFVAGWGKTEYHGKYSDVLLEAQIPVVSNYVCKNNYRKEELGFDFHIDDRVLCAGYREGGIDACQGDSGGPLMIPYKGIYYLIGVVSSGYHCAESGFPGIYTRVTTFINFIISNMS